MFDIPAGNPALCSPRYVAIVKIEGERQLSALEKIGDNIYALYRLSTQLRMKDIRKVAAQTKNLPYKQIGEPMHDVCEQEWWNGIGSVEYPFEDTPTTDAALDMGVRESGMAEHAAKDHSYVITGGHGNSRLIKKGAPTKLRWCPAHYLKVKTIRILPHRKMCSLQCLEFWSKCNGSISIRSTSQRFFLSICMLSKGAD